MCVCIPLFTLIHTCISVSLSLHTHIYICIHLFTHTHPHIYICIHLFTHTHIYIHIYLYPSLYTHTHTHTYIYTYIYTHFVCVCICENLFGVFICCGPYYSSHIRFDLFNIIYIVTIDPFSSTSRMSPPLIGLVNWLAALTLIPYSKQYIC